MSLATVISQLITVDPLNLILSEKKKQHSLSSRDSWPFDNQQASASNIMHLELIILWLGEP